MKSKEVTQANYYPPHDQLKKVLRHIPKAGFLFLQLWERQKQLKVNVKKNEVQSIFFVTTTRFRNDLFCLMREGLIDVEETMYEYKIYFKDE